MVRAARPRRTRRDVSAPGLGQQGPRQQAHTPGALRRRDRQAGGPREPRSLAPPCWLPWLGVLALVLAPGMARAQEPGDGVPLVPAPVVRDTGERATLRPVGAFLAGAAAGASLGLGLREWTSRSDFPVASLRGSALLPVVGLTMGAGLGVWTVGKMLGGRGSLVAAFAGSVPGAVLAYVGGERDRESPLVFVGAPLAVVGSVVAYELSAPDEAPVVPTVALMSGGGSVGLVGWF